MIRSLLSVLGLAVLTSCSVGQTAQRVLTPSIQAQAAPQQFARQARAGAPRMQLTVQRVRASGIVVLDVDRDGNQTWLSPEGASFVTRQGVLVATRGLGGDMLASDVDQTLARLAARQPGRAERFHTFIDGQDMAVTRSYICDLTITGPRELTLQGTVTPTLQMAESCASSTQTFRNLYWISNATGQVVQSIQWSGDVTGPLALRPLRQDS